MNLSKLLLLILILNYSKSDYMKQDFPKSLYALRLPNFVRPDHYEITLEQQDEESNKILFNGTCLIFLRLLFTSREIYLHAQRPYIELYTIAAYKRNSTYANEPAIVTYNIIDHMYAISFKRDLIKGHYTLKLTFSTFLENNEENFFEMRYKSLIRDNEWMLATQCYPIGARHVFPCFDNPSFKATFNISIKHSDHYMVLSNMPVRNTSRVSNTMEWTHFHQTPVMSTYLVAIMLTQFPRTSVKEIKFIHRTLQSALDTEFAQKVIQNISLYFESEWLCFQKLPKVDHVVIPNFLRNGVEYWGLIYYRESAIICNEEFESVGRKVDVARLIAQKIAYQWYGNLISPLWWSDAWLYEGLTTILAADAINKIYPKFHIWDLFVVQIQQESLRLDSVMKPVASEVKTSSDLNSVFSFEYYLKGPALLRMLRYAVQTEVFDSAVKSFLDKYSTNPDKFWISSKEAIDLFSTKSTASPIHFWNVLQETMNSSTVSYRRFDVEDMMDSWIYSSKRPVLKMTKNDSKSVVISVEDNYLRHETKPWIPVTRVTLKHDFEMYRDPDVIWLKPTNDRTKSYTNYIIDSNFHWIILNVEQAGYYRVNYETDNWRNIANYLNDINNYTNIHVLNRAQLIDDAFYFLNIGQLQLSVFLNLAEYLQYETDYVAWFPMFKGLEYISPYSMFPESNDFLGTIKYALIKLLHKIGFQENIVDDDLTKSLRQEAARWLCTFNVMHCIRNAYLMLKYHLENLHSHKISPWWKKWVFCNGLSFSDSNDEAWLFMLKEWKDSNDTTIMKYVSCSRSAYAMYNYINLTNNASENCNSGNQCEDANMLTRKRVNRFLYVVAKNAKENVIFDYIKDNYDKIKPREVSTVATFIIMINHIYSSFKLDEVRILMQHLIRYSKTEKFVIGAPHVLLDHVLSLEEINICLRDKLYLLSAHISSKISLRNLQITEQRYMFDNFRSKHLDEFI